MNMLAALCYKGFADLGDFYPGASAAEAAQQVAAMLSASIWRTPETLSANAVNSKPLNTYAGNYGLGLLPLHTDLAHWHIPPRYLMLRCAVGDPNVQTRLLHHEDALRGLPVSTIDRALFRPRRRLDGRMFLVRLRHHGVFRWDQLFLTPDNAEAQEVRAAFVETGMNDCGEAVIFDRPGRTVVIDNWQVLRGRGPVAQSSLHRRIERAYFSGGMTNKTPHEWSSDALMAKAQRFATKMLEQPREDWQFAFWSSLCLEMLVRAAVATASPALLADAKDWNNVSAARLS